MLHVYCGDGKGKTTCALGLALRAAGAGMNVVIVQFLKGSHTSELESIELIPNIIILRNKQDYGFVNNMTAEQLEQIKAEHNANLDKTLQLVDENKCDMLILDEVTYAYSMDIADKNKIEKLIKNRKNDIEMVVTGRDPDKFFIENADYITEMKCVKHPFEKGISARKGIEF